MMTLQVFITEVDRGYVWSFGCIKHGKLGTAPPGGVGTIPRELAVAPPTLISHAFPSPEAISKAITDLPQPDLANASGSPRVSHVPRSNFEVQVVNDGEANEGGEAQGKGKPKRWLSSVTKLKEDQVSACIAFYRWGSIIPPSAENPRGHD